ncbi:uncharacterized protein LODBEIA_P27780 [Lodderomyces beijingensis]|uniref:Serine/threonine-protein phosphatase 4 regulatory subunit 3-like central domain-containing protein n=1 Tax=Lodderomyces beijingensis TaxID=1775926 RepID=A0ABP0ZKZ2_9ASCO
METAEGKSGCDEGQAIVTQSRREILERLESAGSTPRRVKVYLLNGEDWLDNGTGYCVGEIEEETNDAYFTVRKETKLDEVILKSKLEGSIQYQRQQDTLIVWTDTTGSDLALSFQEAEGCADLCDFIIKVQQGNFSPNISLYYVVSNAQEGEDITELVAGPVRYPPQTPSIDNVGAILESLNQGANAQFTRTNLVEYMIDIDYFEKLARVFEEAERLNRKQCLHEISDIVKLLFAYNEPSLVDDMLSSETKILSLAGMLEYDSEYPDFKADHRALLENKSYKLVIPVENLNIFKMDFYLNTLKDVVLVRFLDGQPLTLITSKIYDNQIRIFNYLEKGNYLRKLFDIYREDKKVDVESRRDGVRMLHQYVQIAKSLSKQDFFALLVKVGMFKMISFALKDDNDKIRILGTEIIVSAIEHDVSLINSNANAHDESIDNSDPPAPHAPSAKIDMMSDDKQLAEEQSDASAEPKQMRMKLADDMTLVSKLIKLLVSDENIGLKHQTFEALRILLDSNITANSSNDDENSDEGGEDLEIAPNSGFHEDTDEDFQDIRAHNYFQAFFTRLAPALFREIIVIGKHSTSSAILAGKFSDDKSVLFQLLCELTNFFLKEHDIGLVSAFLTENEVIQGLVKILNSDSKPVLKLHVLRCFKKIILANDDRLTGHILANGILGHFIKFFETVVTKNNLACSTCLDLLDNIRRFSDSSSYDRCGNFQKIAKRLVEDHRDFLQNEISYVSTGVDLITLTENDFNSSRHTSILVNCESESYNGSAVSKFQELVEEDDSSGELELIKTDEAGSSDEEMLQNNSSTPRNDDNVDEPTELCKKTLVDSPQLDQEPKRVSFRVGEKRPRDYCEEENETIESENSKKSSKESSADGTFVATDENDSGSDDKSPIASVVSSELDASPKSNTSCSNFETSNKVVIVGARSEAANGN